jgi:NADH:ubiquinone reductase (H+-translocating)
MVKNITPEPRRTRRWRVIEAGNIIWAAGVGAHPVTRQLGVELDRAGRIQVNPDLSIPGHPEAFALGDIALVLDSQGQAGSRVSPPPCRWRDTLPASRAELRTSRSTGFGCGTGVPPFVISTREPWRPSAGRRRWRRLAGCSFSGWSAWMAWLVVHLLFLIGFDNKLGVLLQWTYSYFTYHRGARIIIDGPGALRSVEPNHPRSCSDPASICMKAR